MELEVLKKKISTYRGSGGRVRITDDSLYMEILSAWEQWTGTTKNFYTSIGLSKTGIAGIIGKAKRLRREGCFPAESFKEIKLATTTEGSDVSSSSGSGITMKWEKGRVIKFSQVSQLVEFLDIMESKNAA